MQFRAAASLKRAAEQPEEGTDTGQTPPADTLGAPPPARVRNRLRPGSEEARGRLNLATDLESPSRGQGCCRGGGSTSVGAAAPGSGRAELEGGTGQLHFPTALTAKQLLGEGWSLGGGARGWSSVGHMAEVEPRVKVRDDSTSPRPNLRLTLKVRGQALQAKEGAGFHRSVLGPEAEPQVAPDARPNPPTRLSPSPLWEPSSGCCCPPPHPHPGTIGFPSACLPSSAEEVATMNRARISARLRREAAGRKPRRKSATFCQV